MNTPIERLQAALGLKAMEARLENLRLTLRQTGVVKAAPEAWRDMKTKIWVATFNTGTHGVLTAVSDHEPSDEEQTKLWPEEQIQVTLELNSKEEKLLG
jgi:hypothetical protein